MHPAATVDCLVLCLCTLEGCYLDIQAVIRLGLPVRPGHQCHLPFQILRIQKQVIEKETLIRVGWGKPRGHGIRGVSWCL